MFFPTRSVIEEVLMDNGSLAGFDAPGHELRDVVLDGITVENETGTMTLPVQYCRGLTIRDLTCAARK